MTASRPARVLAILTVAALLSAVCFLTVGVRGNWGFVLPFRGVKLAGMVLVGVAVAISTVLFQTLTQNRILTPAVMGFDALYGTIQTALVFFLGTRATNALDPGFRFLLHSVLMILAVAALFRWLFASGRRDLHLMLLAGIVFGVFCRSLSGFLQRILDPNEFAVLQDMLFARFNSIDATLLPLAATLIAAAALAAWRMVPALDVLALGREIAINLGLDHRRISAAVLVIVAVLVSVSTALVGPVLFFGLLVANLAYHLIGSESHRYALPAASLISVSCLVGGQTILERLLGLDTALSIVIEFVGGSVFLALLLRGDRR